jgi:hypothetical protein
LYDREIEEGMKKKHIESMRKPLIILSMNRPFPRETRVSVTMTLIPSLQQMEEKKGRTPLNEFSFPKLFNKGLAHDEFGATMCMSSSSFTLGSHRRKTLIYIHIRSVIFQET